MTADDTRSGTSWPDVDAALQHELAALGIGRDTFAALTVVPLAAIAWADGHVDESERRLVLAAAHRAGVRDDGRGRQLVQLLLDAPPPPALWKVWRAYVASTCATLSEGERRRWRDRVVADARRIAEAAGGFKTLLPKTSVDEARLLDEIARAFTH